MPLPIKTTEKDVKKIVDYLKTKATGTTIKEAQSVLGKKILDPRKINACAIWGFIQKEGNRLKLDTLGQKLSRAKSEKKASIYQQVINNIELYRVAVEWIYHQKYDEISNVEVARHWHEHYKNSLGTDNENSIREMANCFFHITQAAGVGNLTFGRKGAPTRLSTSKENLEQFIAQGPSLKTETSPEAISGEIEEMGEEMLEEEPETIEEEKPLLKPKIFISHSKNQDIVEQIKTMLELADMNYEVAEEVETTAIPIPEKILTSMQNCNAAIICVTADEKEKREDNVYGINQNVLIEIGSVFVTYDKRVILVWDKRVDVPSNLQGLYRCEFSGDELSWSEGMKLMKALNSFKSDISKLEK